MQLFLNRDHQVNAMSLMMIFLDCCILLQTAYCLLFLNTTNTSYFDSHHMAYIFLEIWLKCHYVHVDNSFHLRLSLMVSINWILHHIIWATTLVKKVHMILWHPTQNLAPKVNTSNALCTMTAAQYLGKQFSARTFYVMVPN